MTNNIVLTWTRRTVSGFESEFGPGLASFGGSLYLAHRGKGGNENIFVARGDGSSWSAKEVVLPYKTSARPALAVFEGRLYLAHRGKGGNTNLFITSSSDGKHWSSETVVAGYKSERGPALAAFNGRLYLAHRGKGGNDNLFCTSTTDGKNWSKAKLVRNYKSEYGPALAVHNGRLFLAHRGKGGNENIFVTSTANGEDWEEASIAGSYKTDRGPALCSHDGWLLLASRGKDSDRNIYVARSRDGSSWANATRLNYETNGGPALAVHSGRVHLAHRGGIDNALWVGSEINLVDSGDVPQVVDAALPRPIPSPGSVAQKAHSRFLLAKAALPARYVTVGDLVWPGLASFMHSAPVVKEKVAHLEFFMRLDLPSDDGSAYFLFTHSQAHGGYVAIARVGADALAPPPNLHRIAWVNPQKFAGEVVWFEHLDANHRSRGANHPGNGGQVGSIVAIVAQDWKEPRTQGFALPMVGHGSKVLFYDVSNPNEPTYLGMRTAAQLELGTDEITSAGIERGPDGMIYLFASQDEHTVIWKAKTAHPGADWQRIDFHGAFSLNDGSAQLRWARLGAARPALYFVKAEGSGMAFHEVRFTVDGDRRTTGLHVDSQPALRTQHDKGFAGWVSEDGSYYVSPEGRVALYGASVDVSETLETRDGKRAQAIQVRAWYQPDKPPIIHSASKPGRASDTDVVTFYEHGNYQGRSSALGAGRHDIDQLGVPNDSLSSVRVPAGLIAIVYEHAGFQGRQRVLIEDCSFLRDFNDLVSSVEIRRVERSTQVVTLYEHARYQGNSLALSPGSYDIGALGRVGNDRVSSLRVPPGLRVTLFEHGGFHGRRKSFTADERFVGLDFNDVTSAVIVEQVATIYEHENYQGRSSILAPGKYDIGDIGLSNDTLSSLRVPAGLAVILYEHAGFSGRSRVHVSDCGLLRDFNDVVSSIEVRTL